MKKLTTFKAIKKGKKEERKKMWFSLVGEGRKRKESGEPLISF
jgi:hypothetical protein